MNKVAALLFALMVAAPAYSQDIGEQVNITSLVGDTLRPAARNHFGLFPDVRGFRWAVFFLAEDSLVNARVNFDNGHGIPADTLIMNYGTLQSLHAQLRRVDTLSADSAKVMLKDGSIISGAILGETTSDLIVATEHLGELVIPKSDVQRISRRRIGQVGGYFGLEKDPNATRAFLMPTANTLPAGDGYVGDYELFFFTASVGLTDWLMVNAGTLLIPVSVENEVVDYGFKARVFEIPDKVAFAVGVQMITPLSVGESAGIAYGVVSVGNADMKGNLALGKTFATFGGSSMVVGVSGDARVGESIKLLAELWVLPDVDWVPLVVGVRFFGSHLSGDLGLMYPVGVSLGSPIGIPVANFIYNF